jgi:hypothetical protein
MKYQAFTNDSLAMMHHGARGALAVDDELSKLGEEPRFKVRSTSDWAQHAADLETEMLRRGMSFEAIDLSASGRIEPVAEAPIPAEPPPGEPASTEPVSIDSVVAEPDLTGSVSSESAPTAPTLPNSAAPAPASESPKSAKVLESAQNAADQDTRLRSRIAAVLKIRS